MSMLTGGRADKYGNDYENWWMVRQLIRLIEGEIETICIEDPRVEKAECLITSQDGDELHQNKRSRASGSWTLSKLGQNGEKILEAIFRQLIGNTRTFHFVSGSDAPELKALSEQARLVSTVKEFEEYVISVETHEKTYQALSDEWGSPSVHVAFCVLTRIFVRVLDEAAILDQINSGLRALFLSGHSTIRTALREVVSDRVGDTLTCKELRRHLTDSGNQFRAITDSASAARKVDELTEQYLVEVRRRLIGKSLISREISGEIVGRLQSAGEQTDVLVVSEAGGGKSVCLMDVTEQLVSAGFPVLTFRLDRLKPTTTGFKIGEQMGLEESPAFVLSNLDTSKPAVLVIDQLDAVSTASGRSSEFINAVESLLEDVRALKRKRPVHVILACRQFDLDNDHRLRKLTDQKKSRFQLGDFTGAEVDKVLEGLSIDETLLNERQLDLLARPQNLSLFSQLSDFSESVTRFGSTKDLFDAYWTEKRMAVSQRLGTGEDHWTGVIDRLTAKMTKIRQLSVARENLDEFPSQYLDQMISEGVISLQAGRYGFGHESFFDYCFARRFVRENESLVSVLLLSEQHLFRRAQVRQVFAYLRDSDQTKYVEQMSELLNSNEIRIHIKDLALSLLAAVPSVTHAEWDIIEPWLQGNVDMVEAGTTESNAFSRLVWQHFFFSNSWFLYTDSIGWPERWLNSDCENLVDLGINYLHRHQRKNGDRVAQLLAPFKDQSGAWKYWLKGLMQWAELKESRPFFELFLDLVSNGVLDEARGPIAVNSNFWDMIHGLDDSHPSWVIELLVVWLRRRREIILEGATDDEGSPKWNDFFQSGQSGAMTIHKAAESCPDEIIESLLPLAIELAEQSSYEGDSAPFRDAVWGFSFSSRYPGLRQACESILCRSLEKIARERPENLASVVSNLREGEGYYANRLLFCIFTAGASFFADQALALLEEETWRFRCGRSDSNYWFARCLVGAIGPHLSAERMQDLENLVLSYRSTWEQTWGGRRAFGDAVYTLIGAIPQELLSQEGLKRVAELERKFGKIDRIPQEIAGDVVVSPISSDAEEKMTDDQWRSAIKKYSASDRDRCSGNFLKGGAREFAHSMEPFIKKEPERFARLALTLPSTTNAVYISWILRSLSGTNCSLDLKLSVASKAFSEYRIECARDLAGLLGGIESRLDDEFIEMLHWIAIEHPDPERELWLPTDGDSTEYYGGSVSDCGLNSDRGRAVLAIADLIQKDEDYLQRFATTIEALVGEELLSVRSCVLRITHGISRYDTARAIELFLEVTQLDPRLLAIHYADHFLVWAIKENFSNLEPSLLALLRSSEEKHQNVGARLLSLAKLYGHSTDSYIEEALSGSPSHRSGVADVAAENIGLSETRDWCESILLRLFSDQDSSVNSAAANCFHKLKESDLSDYDELVSNFSGSHSFKSNSGTLMRVLENTKYRLPQLTMNVCEDFILQISSENTNVFSQNYVDSSTLGTLVFRIYQQYQTDSLAVKALDLIDEMIIFGLGEADRNFVQFER